MKKRRKEEQKKKNPTNKNKRNRGKRSKEIKYGRRIINMYATKEAKVR